MKTTLWAQCFEEYNKLQFEYRRLLRTIAINNMMESGFEEIGSSDINHSLFNMWIGNGKNWELALHTEFVQLSASG
jgi:ADP-glucose pyrophosphorylase